MIKENIATIEENIQKACDKSARDIDEVTLIAVSKTQPISMIEEAYDNGLLIFGENKVQELVAKYEEIEKNKTKLTNVEWHLIGHLQRNKVKYIVDKVTLIHSVDSLKLAKQIEKEAKKNEINVDILIEVNIAEDPNKFGLKENEVLPAIQEISKLKRVNIKGLMTVPPYADNPEDNRGHFRKMKQLFIDIDQENIDNVSMEILSMGMSGDYGVAIEEGATMVRIGSSIFGDRNYE